MYPYSSSARLFQLVLPVLLPDTNKPNDTEACSPVACIFRRACLSGCQQPEKDAPPRDAARTSAHLAVSLTQSRASVSWNGITAPCSSAHASAPAHASANRRPWRRYEMEQASKKRENPEPGQPKQVRGPTSNRQSGRPSTLPKTRVGEERRGFQQGRAGQAGMALTGDTYILYLFIIRCMGCTMKIHGQVHSERRSLVANHQDPMSPFAEAVEGSPLAAWVC